MKINLKGRSHRFRNGVVGLVQRRRKGGYRYYIHTCKIKNSMEASVSTRLGTLGRGEKHTVEHRINRT